MHTYNYIYFKSNICWNYFNKFKLHDYVHMYVLTVVLFQRTVLQYNEKCGGMGIKQIKKATCFDNFKLSIS